MTPCRRRRKSNEHRSRFAAARGVGHFARLIGFSGPLENPPACTRTNLIFFRRLAVTTLSDPGAKPSGTFFSSFVCFWSVFAPESLTCFDVKLKALRYGSESTAVRCGFFPHYPVFLAIACCSLFLHVLLSQAEFRGKYAWILTSPCVRVCESVCACVCTLAPLLTAFTMETADG